LAQNQETVAVLQFRETETSLLSTAELLLYGSPTALVFLSWWCFICSKMADVSVDQFSCPVCLDVLNNPVTTPCGHSFCLGCINGCWDQEDLKGEYSCPQCRRSFTPRPVLSKSVMLVEMMEKLKTSAPAESVDCDACIGRKLRAVKSCLVCLASFCETHLQPHYLSPAFKKHKLVKASRRLQEQICPQHEKHLEVYCCTDQQCICMLCTMDDHKGHDTVSAAAERAEKEKKLMETKTRLQQRIQEREKEAEELRNAVESHKRSAQTAVENTEKIFADLIRSIERRRSELSELIRAQENAAVSRAEGALRRLEQEISELRCRNTELEQLSLSEDHIHFLQSFQPLSVPPGSAGLTSIIFSPNNSFQEVLNSVSQLREKVEQLFEEEFKKISSGVKKIQVILPPEPKTRAEFLEYAADLTLDPNTVSRSLSLSERNRKAEWVAEVQSYPDHPDRFDHWPQVLSVESLTGRRYWEVRWSGEADISVSYRGIRRKGSSYDCGFGYSDQSWSLNCTNNRYTVRHNKQKIVLPAPPTSPSKRVGVFLDWGSSTLSFYTVSPDTHTLTHLHTLTTTFTEPLYAGFWIAKNSSVSLCERERERSRCVLQ
ncbi:hypothetical protein AOLI_G00091820, partial [Acnodon oligacanthus]